MHNNSRKTILRMTNDSYAGLVGGENMRRFYLACTPSNISETPSRIFQSTAPNLDSLSTMFILPWSHDTLMLRSSRSPISFSLYHAETLSGVRPVRQLRQKNEKVMATESKRTRKAMEARTE